MGFLSSYRITGKFHGNWHTLQRNLRMQIVDSSIKFSSLLPQRPAPLAFVYPVHPTAPLYPPWGSFHCHQVSAQSLEAIAVIMPESVGRISGCCMHFACKFSLAARRTVYSQVIAFTSFLDTIFLVLFPSFAQKDFPIGVLPTSQHRVG